MAETTTPHPDHPDHATARVIAYLNALDHERATLGGRKHFFLDGRIDERHGTDGNTHALYRGDLRSLLADLAVARAGYLAMEQHAHALEADLQRASDAINVAVARAQRAEAVLEANDARADRAEDERDQLRRQLDAAEAQPCDHNSDAFEALERLHGRIHRDFNFDASESAAPDDERWARVMDDLVTFADEVYLPLADATRAAPQPSTGDDETDKYPPHTVTVTHLPPGFDHQDRHEHEYVVGNDIVGWTSHQVEHPDACHRLPYGRHCWLDENWYEGPYRYDEIEPGRYQATRVSEMIGDHNGEFSHMDEYVHYERTGDAPGQDAEPGPLESAVTEALADITTTPADPEPAAPKPPWLVEAGDD